MTNTRITSEQVVEWGYCPWCGDKLTEDQDPSLLVYDIEGELDVEASRAAGYDFDHSLKHCGFDIRLWVPDDGSERFQ